MKNINKAIAFAKKETVLIVAMLLAVISAFFVTPDKAYASYIDFRTLGLLFSLMTVTEGCKGLGIFERSAKFIISKVNTAFQLSIVLVGLCFFSSMFITNDVSLLTFVPLTLTALSTLGESGNKLLIPIVVMQTIAAYRQSSESIPFWCIRYEAGRFSCTYASLYYCGRSDAFSVDACSV